MNYQLEVLVYNPYTANLVDCLHLRLFSSPVLRCKPRTLPRFKHVVFIYGGKLFCFFPFCGVFWGEKSKDDWSLTTLNVATYVTPLRNLRMLTLAAKKKKKKRNNWGQKKSTPTFLRSSKICVMWFWGFKGDCLTITNPTEKHTNLQQTLFYISINICIDVTEIYGPIILSVDSSVHETSEQRRRTIEFCFRTFTVIPRNLPETCHKNCGVQRKRRKEIPCRFALF